MTARTGPVGWFTLVAALTYSAAAHATFGPPAMGRSRTARLPRSLQQAEQLASRAREPAPIPLASPTDAQSRAFSLRYWQWLKRVTDAAARAGAWYLTAILGPEPFREQLGDLRLFPDELPPRLGPSTAAYLIIGETRESDWSPLEHAIATPPAGASPEHFVETLADVGFLFADIRTSVRNGAEPDGPDYVSAVVEVTDPVVKVLLRQCRRISTAQQIWTRASRRCEEWLGAHWKAELTLASLDELLPIADRRSLTRLGFAPVVLPGRP